MGGDGSGRKPSVETLIRQSQPVQTPVGNGLFLPDYSGIQKEALKTEVPILTTGDYIGSTYGYKDILNEQNRCNVFDGVDDYVEIPHNDAQLGANLSQGFTISAWINPRSMGETQGRILDKSSAAGQAGETGFQLGLNAGVNVRFRLNAGTGGNSGNLTMGTWVHYLLTVNSAQICQHYLNGVASGASWDSVQPISAITATAVMRIGNRSGATDRTFDGSIRSVKMWNRVLTTDEIAQDYAGITPANPIHHFKLGGDYTDYGSVGAAATNSGSVVSNVFDAPIITNSSILVSGASTAPLVVASGATTLLYVKGNSTIGIGTTTPDQKLTISGALSYSNSSVPTLTLAASSGALFVSGAELWYIGGAGTVSRVAVA